MIDVVGDCVLVKFSGKSQVDHFIGFVEIIDRDDLKGKFMTKVQIASGLKY